MHWRGNGTVWARGQGVGGDRVWLLALTLLALMLRAYRVDFQPLWWDEGWTVYFATADVPSMIARTAIDIHPPFYYLILHLWTLIIGPSAVSVRLFSVGIGTLSVPLMFLVARRLFGRRTALIATLILVVAPFHVYYSQEARMYALVMLLALASSYLFLLLLEEGTSRAKRRVCWILYVLATSMAMYTQYYAAFLPAAQTLFLLLRFRRYKYVLPGWIAAQGALLVAYLPWLLYAGPKLVAYVAEKLVKEGDVPTGLWMYLYDHFLAFSVGHLSAEGHLLSLLAVVFAALALVGAVSCFVASHRLEQVWWPTADAALYVLLCLFLPLALGYLVNLRFPFTSPGIERLFLFSVPAFYILVAVGVLWLRVRFRVPGPLVALLVVGVSIPPLWDFYSSARYVGEDYRPVVQEVQALARPEDVIVAVHPWQIGYFQAYYRGKLPELYVSPKEALDVTSEQWAADRAQMVRDLDSLLAKHRFLWFPAHETLGRIIETQVEGYLFEQQYPVLNQWFSQSTRLSCYTASRTMTKVSERTNYGGKVSLFEYGVTADTLEAGWGVALVELRWKIEGKLDGRYQMALRLVDEQGRAWAAEDREPQGGLRPFHEQPVGSEVDDHQALLVPAGTPPGSYRLELGLYRLQNGEWLDVLDEAGAPQGVEKVLGEVSVTVASVPPPQEALSIQYLRTAGYSSGVRFLGYSLGGETYQPGDALDLTLFWKATTDLHEDYRFSLKLADGQGKAWATLEDQPAGSAYPTSQWKQGQLFRGLFRLMVPAETPSGEYHLVLTLYDPTDGRPVLLRQWLLDWGEAYTMGAVVVEGRAHQTEPPASIQHPLSARLGESIQLLGYDLDQQEVAAGDTLHLTLYWQALGEMETSYNVFNHLIDDHNRIWGQRDGIPGGNTLPTSSWISGEYVVDKYEIPVQADTPPGEYVLETGMYDLATMVRLPVTDSEGAVIGDRVLLEATPVQVR
jgi:4-amino-4-deoxy-L-arabinose transferase-like glycosyltransferase